ncbi:MAG: hypothetical protein JSS82_08060 [Bacteroidetes bacterium]|nr:hypothetical protein [Bacteroidota bacterium]
MAIIRLEGVLTVYIENKDWNEPGTIECVIRPVLHHTRPAYEADMWQGGQMLLQTITMFRAVVYLRLEGDRYRVFDPKGYRDANEFWKMLETTISGIILSNT